MTECLKCGEESIGTIKGEYKNGAFCFHVCMKCYLEIENLIVGDKIK